MISVQLVAVGDQNTGKSSVLQAITEVSFPVKDSTCTRFPIQISFRQAPGPPKVRARIVLGRLSEDDVALQERIRDFYIERTEITPDIMDQVIQEVCTVSLWRS
jgi:GTPase SAR1 family protein